MDEIHFSHPWNPCPSKLTCFSNNLFNWVFKFLVQGLVFLVLVCVCELLAHCGDHITHFSVCLHGWNSLFSSTKPLPFEFISSVAIVKNALKIYISSICFKSKLNMCFLTPKTIIDSQNRHYNINMMYVAPIWKYLT